jgi:hypothetical protein
VADDKGWRRFPQFEKTFDAGQMASMLEKIRSTCKQLDAIVQTGREEEKVRAQTTMTAYGRALELVQELAEMREAAANK